MTRKITAFALFVLIILAMAALPTTLVKADTQANMVPRAGQLQLLGIEAGSYKYLGAETSYGKNTGVMANMYVTNPSVPHDGSTNSFFYSWAMIYSSSRTKWIQVGWSEVSWKDNKQYVTEYDTQHNQWYFYTQYSLIVGSSYRFSINYQGSGSWSAWIWWNSKWNLLTTASIGLYSAERTGQFCEVYSARSSWFYVPNTKLYPTYLLISGQWKLWTTAYPTSTYSSNPPYYIYWIYRYYNWYIYKR